jgi:hypothetical protein
MVPLFHAQARAQGNNTTHRNQDLLFDGSQSKQLFLVAHKMNWLHRDTENTVFIEINGPY